MTQQGQIQILRHNRYIIQMTWLHNWSMIFGFRIFALHRGLSGQNIRPLWLCFYLTLYLWRYWYFFLSLTLLDIIMVPVVMRVANIMKISSLKMVPKLLVYTDPRFIVVVNFYLVKQCEVESTDIFEILLYFRTVNVFFANQCLIVWSTTIVFP